MSPAITVLISAYNDRALVPKKLAEIQAQTLFVQAEFIFIETGSPGRERELFEPFCAQHPHCRLLALDERKTLYEAWNLGWRAASAPLLCNSNMDDQMHPRLLEQVVNSMNRRRWDAATVLIVKDQLKDEAADWSPRVLSRLPLSLRPGPFTVWRNELKETLGLFDGQFIGAGDKDFWARMLAQRCRLGLIPKVLYRYCKSPQQLSKTDVNGERKRRDEQQIDAKPYPHRWSSRIRWQIFWIRYLFRCFPRWYHLPATDPSH